MRHLGQDIKRPIAAVGKTEDRGTRATLSIFKGAIKRARPLQSTWNTVEPESCWCCPCFHPPCISLSVTANKTISSVSYSPYLPTFAGHGWRRATLPSGHSCLIKEKEVFVATASDRVSPPYEKQCRIHSPAQSKQRETLLLDLTERTTWMQTDPALQIGPPEWGVLFDLIPAMRPEPHAHTDFTGITQDCCLHWGYSTTKSGNPLRMPKVWIFPW